MFGAKTVMAKRKPLDIKPEELTELEFIARSGKAEKRLVQRAQIILCWNEGKSFVETQQRLCVSEVIINKWRQRFSKYRLEGLKDSPRSGKPPVYSAAKKACVIALATKKPGKGALLNRWA
jgi:transposase